MHTVEIDNVRILTTRRIKQSARVATEITGEDTSGCGFKITLWHDGVPKRLPAASPRHPRGRA